MGSPKVIWGHSRFKMIFRNNKAQVCSTTMFGKLGDRMVCCGSAVIKRKQQLGMEKAEKAKGILVDLPPDALEGYGLEILLVVCK